MNEEENSYRAEVASSGYISEMGSAPLWISSNILPSVSSEKEGNRIAHYNNVGPSAGAWNARVSRRAAGTIDTPVSFLISPLFIKFQPPRALWEI